MQVCEYPETTRCSSGLRGRSDVTSRYVRPCYGASDGMAAAVHVGRERQLAMRGIRGWYGGYVNRRISRLPGRENGSPEWGVVARESSRPGYERGNLPLFSLLLFYPLSKYATSGNARFPCIARVGGRHLSGFPRNRRSVTL